jgi:betaine-aldehyde dehydrogenase/5-carboxymethyl-2-hydroxymuconic-semialdehyde dehydrogenase
VITPWNAPFMLSTWKTAPALAAGCTVILKPAEWSPLSCSLLGDLTERRAFPPAVFNVVQGSARRSARRCRAPGVRRISFTGSPETAVHIGTAAARNIVPFTGELGGKGPLLVFADADLEAAARKAAGQYDDAGQVCLAGTRLLVEASVEDEFLELFHRFTDEHVLGDPRDDATTVSPLDPPDHLARVEGSSSAPGERRRDRARRPAPRGRRPALLRPDARRSRARTTRRSSSARCSARCSLSRRSPTRTEAVALANSTRYGLSGIRLHGLGGTRRPGRPRSARGHALGQHLSSCATSRRRSAELGISGIGPGGRRLRARLLLRPEDACRILDGTTA